MTEYLAITQSTKAAPQIYEEGTLLRGDSELQHPRLIALILGNRLDSTSAAFNGFDRSANAVLVLELMEDASYVPQHKIRLALFFSPCVNFATSSLSKA